MQENKTTKAHSEDYFGEWRDFWWNKDFVELMAKRWELNNVHSLLDVGCGIGHWSRVLFPFLPKQASVVGIDMEATSIEKAKTIAHKLSLNERCSYSVALAEKIPFPDNTFDMVTCQTLLIHVKDVVKVLNEMKRVLKPNGILVVGEPNNAASNLMENSLSFDDSIDLKLKRIEFSLTCERGKAILGHGHNSIGELIPGMFAKIDLTDIKVYQSDKASPYIPPYESEEQRVNVKQALEWSENEIYIWEKEQSLKYFVAGGGAESEFNAHWELIQKINTRFKEGIVNKKLYMSGGVVFYLISGRK